LRAARLTFERAVEVSLEKDPVYWQALGEFIEAFASAEIMLFSYFVNHAGIPFSIAKAFWPDIRAVRIIELIGAVWKEKPPDADIRQKLEVVFCKFKKINEIRNSMVHNVSFVTDDKGRVSSNISRRLYINEYRVSPDKIRDMISDLEKIKAHLTYAVIVTAEPWTNRDDLAREAPALAASWRYEPDTHKRKRKVKGP